MLHARIFTDSVGFVDISGFRIEGMRVTVTPGWEYVPCDVVVMYGLANPKRRSRQGVLRTALHREHKGPIVVIESSLIGRSFKRRLPGWIAALRRRPLRPRQIHPYYRVAVGGALGDDADFGSENSPPDRWERLKSEFGIELKPYRTQGDHILVCGQVPMDASLRGVDVLEWLLDTAGAIRNVSSRPILIRLHPSTRWRYQQRVREAFASVPGVTISPGERTLAEDLGAAWACVTYSSGAAVDALIAGVPPICLSTAGLAYGLCSRDISDIERPKEPVREQFLYNLAYSQWTPTELADGTAWRHIRPAVDRALAGTDGRPPSPEFASQNGTVVRADPIRRLFNRILPRQRIKFDVRETEVQRWKTSLARWDAVAKLMPTNPWALLGRARALFHLRRFEEALSVLGRLREIRPGWVVAHEAFARSAEKLGRRTDALDGWAAAASLAPHRMVPLRGRAKAEAALALDDAAETSFALLRKTHASERAGFWGMARLAEKRGDWPRALELYQEIWARFADANAIRQKASILIGLQRSDEARQVVESLKPPSAPVLTYLLAAIPVHKHLLDWPAMDTLLKQYETVVLSDMRLLEPYVDLLVRLGRIEEALELVERGAVAFPDGCGDLKTALLIHARRYDEVDARLQDWLAGKSMAGLKVELLAPLLGAAWERGEGGLCLRILDRLATEASSNQAGQVLRLLTPVHRARILALEGLFSSPPRLMSPTVYPEDTISELIEQSPALRESAFDHDLAREVLASLGELRAKVPAMFPDTNFDLRDALEVALLIVDAADDRRPLSLIRLGDGEGVLLPYRSEHAALQQADRLATRRVWWGDSANVDMDEIGRWLRDAAIESDIVGIPDVHRACITLLNRSTGHVTEGGRSARGLLAAIDFSTCELAKHVQAITSCHIHQSFSYWGIWDLLLPRIGRLSLITCHAGLASALATNHGVTIGTVHLVPPEHKYATGFDAERADRHFPVVFNELREKLANVEPGQAFLVAAGVLGKVYCSWIKQAGGIAIDIGSAADFWCGHETRSIADNNTYRSPTGVAERLRSLLAGHPRFGAIVERQVKIGAPRRGDAGNRKAVSS